jgi:hypothetical protein
VLFNPFKVVTLPESLKIVDVHTDHRVGTHLSSASGTASCSCVPLTSGSDQVPVTEKKDEHDGRNRHQRVLHAPGHAPIAILPRQRSQDDHAHRQRRTQQP